MYTGYLAQRRDRLGPQDSGEWPPVKFRRLRKSTEDKQTVAPILIVSVLVLGVHALCGATLSTEAAVLAVMLLPFFAPVVGILLITSFQRVEVQSAMGLGAVWGILGFFAIAVFHPGMLMAFGVSVLTGTLSFVSAWATAHMFELRRRHGTP